MIRTLSAVVFFASISCGLAAEKGQQGSTLMGCLQKADGADGFVLTEGTGKGSAVSGPANLKKHVGHWVKITGESRTLQSQEHFEARSVQHMSDTCDQATGAERSAAGKQADHRSHSSVEHSGTTVQLKDLQGSSVGTAKLTEAPHGVLIQIEFEGLQAGRHGLHIHEKGACEGPDFKSAGDHFNPDGKSHGYLAGSGHHAGDMPNFEVSGDGKAMLEVLNSRVTLKPNKRNSLVDGDGTALVVHSGEDDYASQPAGDAGDRIACGTIGGRK